MMSTGGLSETRLRAYPRIRNLVRFSPGVLFQQLRGGFVESLWPPDRSLQNLFLDNQGLTFEMLQVQHHGRPGEIRLLDELGQTAWRRLTALAEQSCNSFTARVHAHMD